MSLYDAFKPYAVQADSLKDFCDQYHSKDAYHSRGASYMQFDYDSHKKELEEIGFTFISHHDSATGEIVSYYGERKEQP